MPSKNTERPILVFNTAVVGFLVVLFVLHVDIGGGRPMDYVAFVYGWWLVLGVPLSTGWVLVSRIRRRSEKTSADLLWPVTLLALWFVGVVLAPLFMR